MRMRLYLHIGLSKTGTSAIQTFFYRNREILLKELKILYPQTGILIAGGIPAHHFLAFSLFKPNEAKFFNVNTSFEDYMDQMKKEIDETKPEKVVISSEAFMHYKDEPILEKFSHSLNSLFEEIYILVYLRRQDLWKESSYSQVVKDYGVRVKRIFKESAGYSKELDWLLMYDKFLSRWKTFFPKAKIIPRIYDRKALPNGDVIKDFLSILGIEYGKFENLESDPNPSLSHLSTLALREINEKFDLTPEEHGKIVQYLFKLDKEEGSPLKTFFTLQERIKFLEYFRESNERLFSEWFNCENKFVLSEDEIKFYEEQDKILKEDAEKMVEDRYRKVLAKG